MKIKVSELEGAKLDYWVAKAEGVKIVEDGDGGWFETEFYYNYSPSSDWSQGGPIIEREKIEITPMFDYLNKDLWTGWQAVGCMNEGVGYGKTYLEAAMRCFVAIKFGEEVEESA